MNLLKMVYEFVFGPPKKMVLKEEIKPPKDLGEYLKITSETMDKEKVEALIKMGKDVVQFFDLGVGDDIYALFPSMEKK